MKMSKQVIGQQGEVRIVKIDALPVKMETKPVERLASGFIISHSEKGHHHILTGGDVMERTNDVPAGMQLLYAILDEPHSLIQDAATPHEGFNLEPGIYEFRLSREFNPFLDEARRVAD
jgi:hypothetical protein